MNQPSEKCEIIAEIGLSHEGSLGLAVSMAKAAIENGADLVKFQAHFPEFESSTAESFRVSFAIQDSTRWDYWKRTSFTTKEWMVLKRAVEENGGKFAISVFSGYATEVFLDLGVDVLKLGSGDLVNQELYEVLESYPGTLILSTGLATWAEVTESANWMRSSNCSKDSAILQCTSMYPTPLDKIGLNVMSRIQKELKVPSGLSDHSIGLTASLSALLLGARYIERHITLSPFLYGPDIKASISLEELKFMSEFRNQVKPVFTQVDKDVIATELAEVKMLFGRSLGLKRDLPIGTVIESSDFCLRKPSGGFSWGDRTRFVGKALVKPYMVNELITEDHFSEPGEESP